MELVGYCYAINGWMLKRSPKAGMAHDYDDRCGEERERHRGERKRERDKIEIPGSERASTTALYFVMFHFGWAPGPIVSVLCESLCSI